MTGEVIHIKEGDRYSFCGENLHKSTYDPFLFIAQYRPNQRVYSIQRIVTEDMNFPIHEQVCVVHHPNFCEDCLACMGLLLLGAL